MGKILIVEDEIIMASDLQELLSQFGYQVAVAHSIIETLEIAPDFKPELILCDINLNDNQNGIDLIRMLREKQINFQVIYLTAYSSADVIGQAELTGPFNYLLKPYNDTQVEVAVRLAFNYIRQKPQISGWADKLSHMELKVLEYIAQQKTSKEIAELLFISDKTVRNHRYNITKKLGLPSENNSLSRWAISQFKPGK